jgi:hypothetical protein
MKKATLALAVAILMFLPVAANGQNTDAAAKPSKRPTSLSGEVGRDGKTLRSDRDRRIWKVSNPEIFSGIDGRHVRVRVHMDTTLSEIRIVSVSEIMDESSGIKLDDAAFRR